MGNDKQDLWINIIRNTIGVEVRDAPVGSKPTLSKFAEALKDALHAQAARMKQHNSKCVFKLKKMDESVFYTQRSHATVKSTTHDLQDLLHAISERATSMLQNKYLRTLDKYVAWESDNVDLPSVSSIDMLKMMPHPNRRAKFFTDSVELTDLLIRAMDSNHFIKSIVPTLHALKCFTRYFEYFDDGQKILDADASPNTVKVIKSLFGLGRGNFELKNRFLELISFEIEGRLSELSRCLSSMDNMRNHSDGEAHVNPMLYECVSRADEVLSAIEHFKLLFPGSFNSDIERRAQALVSTLKNHPYLTYCGIRLEVHSDRLTDVAQPSLARMHYAAEYIGQSLKKARSESDSLSKPTEGGAFLPEIIQDSGANIPSPPSRSVLQGYGAAVAADSPVYHRGSAAKRGKAEGAVPATAGTGAVIDLACKRAR